MSGPQITNFINAFKTDLARPCNFDVIITPKSGGNSELGKKLMQKIRDKYNDTYEKGSFRFKCESTDIPSRQMGLVEQNLYGPNFKFPISNAYDDIILRFICSDNMQEKEFFDNWLDVISLPHKNKLKASTDNATPSGDIKYQNLGTDFDFSYKDSYTADIKITQYDLTGGPSYEITLVDAFPYVVRSMPLRWHDNNDYHKLDVHFNFRYFNATNKPEQTGTLKRFLEN